MYCSKYVVLVDYMCLIQRNPLRALRGCKCIGHLTGRDRVKVVSGSEPLRASQNRDCFKLVNCVKCYFVCMFDWVNESV